MIRKRRYTGLFAAALGCYLAAIPIELAAVRFSRSDITGIDRQLVAQHLSHHLARGEFPGTLELTARDRSIGARVRYTLDEQLQDTLRSVYARYRPDYGSFVAIDPGSGAVLAIVNYVKDGAQWGNLALQANFPAASVFKIVTAAAALDRGVLSPTSITPYNGKRTSLYKRQVLRHKENRWTRKPTLKKAFAQSVNTVFARIGIFEVGALGLQDYANRFGFNTVIDADLLFETGQTHIEDDQWSIAEAASGYTNSNTLSPMHGALIAAAIINDGGMTRPYLVELLTDDHGIPLYEWRREMPRHIIDEASARQLRVLMRETVRSGSARRSFRGFFRGSLKDVEVGGKTGSLTGTEPQGRNDWFVGYASRGGRRLAFASLTVNKEKWTVKSAYVARRVIEAFFSDRG